MYSLITNPRKILLWNNCRIPCHLKTYLLKFYLHVHVASWPRSYVASRFNVSGANPRIIGHSKLFENISPYDNYPFSEQLSVFRERMKRHFNVIFFVNLFRSPGNTRLSSTISFPESTVELVLRWPNTVFKCLCLIHHNF